MTDGTLESGGHWWTERWWAVLDAIGLAKCLERGKLYALAERVLAVEVEPGLVTAEVQGSRFKPYRVELGLRIFTDEEWEQAVELLASQALFSTKLLSGEMPENIEEVFSEVGLSLFPASSRELQMVCNCLDTIVPCKHIAALHYVLAEKLEDDPFFLFRWRGWSRERILRELRQQRAAEASGCTLARSSALNLVDRVEDFWTLGESFESVSIAVGPSVVSASLLRRLGLPPCWKPHPEIRGSLERLYAKVTERAMALAFTVRGIRDDDRF
jgi:uncharacterized Zn finger protein